MKGLVLAFLFFMLKPALFSQSFKIMGKWWSPRGFAGVSYQFDSTGAVQFHSFTCMSQFNRSGQYTLSRDSIFIVYDSLSKEEKIFYRIEKEPSLFDTLYVINDHKIKVRDRLFIYDKLFDKTFSLSDSVFMPGLYYRTNQIRFEFDKYVLRKESFSFLDSLVAFMKVNPFLVIEIAQHGTADPRMSTNLSQRRAEAIRKYLISQGLSGERFIAKGYGDSKPIWSEYEIKKVKSKEKKNELRMLNRRTEIFILRTDYQEP